MHIKKGIQNDEKSNLTSSVVFISIARQTIIPFARSRDQICSMNRDTKKDEVLSIQRTNEKRAVKISEFLCDQWTGDIKRHANKFKKDNCLMFPYVIILNPNPVTIEIISYTKP